MHILSAHFTHFLDKLSLFYCNSGHVLFPNTSKARFYIKRELYYKEREKVFQDIGNVSSPDAIPM